MHTIIDPRRMRYVIEVARAQSVSMAAATLSITQSALSRSIAEVEDALEVKLFHRLHRGMTLTAAGDRFVSGAHRILDDIEMLTGAVQDVDDATSGRLRIGFAPATYIGHATRSLRQFAKLYPKVTIETVSGSAQSLGPRLIQGELDLIIGSSSYLKRWRQIALKPLLPMHTAAMVRYGHPLTLQPGKPKEIELLSYPLILPETVETVYSDMALRYAHYDLPSLKPRYVTDNFDVIKSLLSVTDAYYVAMHPSAGFGRLGKGFVFLKNVLKTPAHLVSIASAIAHPRSESALAFERILSERLTRLAVSTAK